MDCCVISASDAEVLNVISPRVQLCWSCTPLDIGSGSDYS